MAEDPDIPGCNVGTTPIEGCAFWCGSGRTTRFESEVASAPGGDKYSVTWIYLDTLNRCCLITDGQYTSVGGATSDPNGIGDLDATNIYICDLPGGNTRLKTREVTFNRDSGVASRRDTFYTRDVAPTKFADELVKETVQNLDATNVNTVEADNA